MASTAREAFDHYLRTGRRMAEGRFSRPVELKFNPDHDPDNGRFTSGPGGTGADEASDGSNIDKPDMDGVDSVWPGPALLRAAELAERAAAGGHSTGDCYKYVKRALLRAGAVSDYLPGIPAKDAGVALAKAASSICLEGREATSNHHMTRRQARYSFMIRLRGRKNNALGISKSARRMASPATMFRRSPAPETRRPASLDVDVG